MKLFNWLLCTVVQPYRFVGAIIGGVASGLLSGAFGSDAAGDAADAQVSSANIAAGVQRDMFNQTQANLSPYMRAGGVALQDLEYLLGTGMGRGDWSQWAGGDSTVPGGDFLSGYAKNFGILSRPFTQADFTASPGYQFNLQEGQNAINKAARASGKAYAPTTLQDLSRFSQGLASNEWNNERNAFRNFQNDLFNRVSGLSGSGQNAAANLGAFAGQAGNQISNAIMGAGNAQAAGIMGSANAMTGGVASAYNNYMANQFLQSAQRPSYGSMGYGTIDPTMAGEGLPY